MENKKYYIYAFLDSTKPGNYIYDDIKFDYEPFYIGKGTGDRIITSSCDKTSPFKGNKIKSIKKRGGSIIKIKILENLGNLESLEIEKSIIEKIGRRDINCGPLTNQTDGGDGRLTSKHSEETKRKISETKKLQHIQTIHTPETKEHLRKVNQGPNNPMYGKHHTEEIKEKHSLRVSGVNHPMFGKKHNELTIKKIKENRKVDQEKMNQISREKNSKSILQFNLDGSYVDEYPSIKEASIKTGISESVIGKNCRGVIKNPKRFIFKFKDLSSNILNNSYKVKIGDIWESYKLIKRNKQSAIVEKDGDIITLRRKDFPIFFEKNVI
jgi:group I intron endonuclease